MADVIGIIGSAVGIISFGLQACKGLIKYYESYKGKREDVERMVSSLQSLTRTLETLKDPLFTKTFSKKQIENISSNIEDCEASMLEFSEVLGKIRESDVTGITGTQNVGFREKFKEVKGRLVYPLRESTILKLQENMAYVSGNLVLAMQSMQLSTIPIIHQKLDHISHDLNGLIISKADEKRETILNWMSAIDHNSKQKEKFSSREEGTGLWLFRTQEFGDWIDGKNKIIWASGGPGVGKTILASSVIDNIRARSRHGNVGVAFLYCDYAERGIQTLEQLLGSIARQLLQNCMRLPLGVIDEYQSSISGKNEQTKAQVLANMIKIALDSSGQVYVIIDALDECENTVRVGLVRKILENIDRVHLFCTSRYMEEDIEKYFKYALRVRVWSSDEDIRIYLRAQISTKSNLVRLCKQHQGLSEKIVDGVAKKTEGMFLLARFHIEALATELRVKHLLRALTALPGDLWLMYTGIVDRIFKGQDEQKAYVARCVLLWACFALRPLKVDEMQHAISAMELNEEDNIVNTDDLYQRDILVTSCAGLVFIDENNFVRFVHYSIQEYLCQIQSSLFSNGNLEVLRTCMKYLSMDSFLEFDPKSETGDLSVEEAQYNSLAIDFPLLNYSCRSWMKMIESREVSKLLSREILDFVSNKYSKRLTLVVSDSLLFRQKDTIFETFTQSRLKEKVLSLASCFAINPLGDFEALLKAVVFNLPGLTEMLLNDGESVDRRFFGNVTALHLAAFTGHSEVLKCLLKYRARVDIVCDTNWGERWSALHLASAQGQHEIARLLERYGLDINAEDTEGRTSLIIAARWSPLATLLGEKKQYLRTTDFLTKQPSRLNATDIQGRDALFWPHSPGIRESFRGVDSGVKAKAGQVTVYPLYMDPYIDEILHEINENVVLQQDDEFMSWLSVLIATGDYPAIPRLQRYPNQYLYKDVLLFIPMENLTVIPQRLLDAIGNKVISVSIILRKHNGTAVFFWSHYFG